MEINPYKRSAIVYEQLQNKQLKQIYASGELDFWYQITNRHELDTLLERDAYFDSLPEDLSLWTDLDLEVSYLRCDDLMNNHQINVSEQKENYRKELVKRGVFDESQN